ncbi:hypothetical protein EJ07DRAFT_141907, partial [Lizonia empirigonia]
TTLATHLLNTASLTLPPSTPRLASLTAPIARLALHPTLEATLHLLNHDLPSAHFLVRHMQAPPALEGMLLHAILHRSEGDMRNAVLWLGDVGDAGAGFVPKRREAGEVLDGAVRGRCGCVGIEGGLVEFVYGEGGVEEGRRLVGDVEGWRERKGGGEEEARLAERIRGEMGRVLEWCVRKFGTEPWPDASSAWVKNSDEVQKTSNDMVSGGKGYREF